MVPAQPLVLQGSLSEGGGKCVINLRRVGALVPYAIEARMEGRLES